MPSIRFARNTTSTEVTGYTPAYLSFGRKIRAPKDLVYDPLLRLNDCLIDAKQHIIRQQDWVKEYEDAKRRQESFKERQKVLLKPHILSQSNKGNTQKFAPRRDGPYLITKKVSPTTYIISSFDTEQTELGRYHVKDLTAFHEATQPVVPKRKR